MKIGSVMGNLVHVYLMIHLKEEACTSISSNVQTEVFSGIIIISFYLAFYILALDSKL